MKKVILFIFCFTILLVSLRGFWGNPTKENINDESWTKGPFELSSERGRFATTFSLIEDGSFQLDLPLAHFAIIDLGYINGGYVSIFAPGVSLLIIPGYLIGKMFGLSQVGSFSVISLFALLNVLLIESIARRLGAKKIHSFIGALAFLFATPAFTYSVSIYQHHISTFLLLAGVWLFFNSRSKLSIFVIWFLAFLSIPVDYPNLFMMFPLITLALLKFIKIDNTSNRLLINFKYGYLLCVLGAVLPIFVFGWINQKAYGNPFQLAGTVTNVEAIDSNGLPKFDYFSEDKSTNEVEINSSGTNSVALGFFNSRNISNGLYIHFLSPDRGIIYYAPFLLFSILGIFLLYKKNPNALALLSAIALMNLFLYSMWGDPWGGWAFGSRYLIPLYAICSIFLAMGLEIITKKKLLLGIFYCVLIYSVFINTLGALTSNANPPKVEVPSLEQLSGRDEKYTFTRNWDYLQQTGSKSFIYNTYLKDILSPVEFYFILATYITLIVTAFALNEAFSSKARISKAS